MVRHHWLLAARSATRAHRTILRGLVGVRRAGSSMKTLMANGKPRILYHLSSGHFGHPASVRRSSSHDTKVSRISPHVTPDPSHRYVHVQTIHEIRCVSRCSSRNPFPAPFGRECRPHITYGAQEALCNCTTALGGSPELMGILLCSQIVGMTLRRCAAAQSA